MAQISRKQADEGIDEPIEALEEAKNKFGVKDSEFVSPDNGQSFVVRTGN